MAGDLDNLQAEIGHRFFNRPLLEQALTHRSLNRQRNNQRLEFLGDRVLGLIVAELLYQAFPAEQEGELARRHAGLVCGEALVQVAQTLHLGDYLHLSASEEGGGGRDNASNLEDGCEALIGALYLDGGLEPARGFIERYWNPLIASAKEPPKDAKTGLQEWAQARGLPLPLYEEITRTGPDHAPEFTIRVSVNGKSAEARAASKRSAEQIAASQLLQKLLGNE